MLLLTNRSKNNVIYMICCPSHIMMTFLARRKVSFVSAWWLLSHVGVLICYTGARRASHEVFKHFIFLQHVLERKGGKSQCSGPHNCNKAPGMVQFCAWQQTPPSALPATASFYWGCFSPVLVKKQLTDVCLPKWLEKHRLGLHFHPENEPQSSVGNSLPKGNLPA